MRFFSDLVSILIYEFLGDMLVSGFRVYLFVYLEFIMCLGVVYWVRFDFKEGDFFFLGWVLLNEVLYVCGWNKYGNLIFVRMFIV